MKRTGSTIILGGIIVVLAAALVGTLLYIKNQPPAPRGVAPIVEIDPYEADSSKWGVNYPNQFTTFQLTESNKARTTFGGSEPYSKLEDDPRLVTLFAGYGFSKDYNEERGHANSLTDVRGTLRVNETAVGTCYSCKSADNPRLWAEIGMAEFYKTLFMELGKQISTLNTNFLPPTAPIIRLESPAPIVICPTPAMGRRNSPPTTCKARC